MRATARSGNRRKQDFTAVLSAEVNRLVGALGRNDVADATITDRMADLQDQTTRLERRLSELDTEEVELSDQVIDPAAAAAAIAQFEPVWQALSPSEQTDMINLLVARVAYDGARETAAITLHPTGISSLAAASDLKEAS